MGRTTIPSDFVSRRIGIPTESGERLDGFAIKRPVTIVMFVLALAPMGGIAYIRPTGYGWRYLPPPADDALCLGYCTGVEPRDGFGTGQRS